MSCDFLLLLTTRLIGFLVSLILRRSSRRRSNPTTHKSIKKPHQTRLLLRQGLLLPFLILIQHLLAVFIKILLHILVPLRRLRSHEIQGENHISRVSSWCLYRGEGSKSEKTGDKGGTRVCRRDRFESLLKGLQVSVRQRWVGGYRSGHGFTTGEFFGDGDFSPFRDLFVLCQKGSDVFEILARKDYNQYLTGKHGGGNYIQGTG
jgi:hypothetical protein